MYESYIYSGIELELAGSKSQPRSVASHSDPFHLLGKRIKEFLTQKHQYNAKYLFRFNDKNAFTK